MRLNVRVRAVAFTDVEEKREYYDYGKMYESTFVVHKRLGLATSCCRLPKHEQSRNC
jgi:hypothetical protein